jgi:acetoacetate decarboxylase
MPDQGRLTEERLPHAAPAIAPLYPKPPWPLPGARVLKLLYETDTDPVLAWLPPKLMRSSPPYAVLTVAHYRDTPIGPFSLAAQHVGCRAGFFIRAFSVQAITDNPSALAALREVWGYPCKLGEVDLDVEANRANAVVRFDGTTVAEASVSDAVPIDGGSVRLDPVLNVRTAPSLEDGKQHDLLQLVQIDPECEVRDAVRGHGTLRFPSESQEAPWHLLPFRNMVAAVSCVVDTELPLARFVMPY